MQNSKEKCSLTEQVIIYEVRTANGKPGKSRNFKNSKLGKSRNFVVGHGKSWKLKVYLLD